MLAVRWQHEIKQELGERHGEKKKKKTYNSFILDLLIKQGGH